MAQEHNRRWPAEDPRRDRREELERDRIQGGETTRGRHSRDNVDYDREDEL